jgi:AraC-like DNA-binding protein
MIIISPQYGQITLNQIDSETVSAPYLNGANTFFCQHDFGTITIQNFQTDQYSITYAALNLVKKISFFIKEETSHLKSISLLDNSINIKSKWKKLKLRKGQFLISNKDNQPLSLYFENLGKYQIFESSFSNNMLDDLFEAFPSLKGYLNKSLKQKYVTRIEQPHFATPELKKLIHDLLECPYDKNLRKLYFENKVNDFLFEILVNAFSKEPKSKPQFTQSEYDAIFSARDIVLKDISHHHSIRALSKMVNLNVLKLKVGFRKTFGSGIFEYLLVARMKKAHDLVTGSDKPIKEIASLTGFEFVQNFIKSFRKYYGITPGELRRK